MDSKLAAIVAMYSPQLRAAERVWNGQPSAVILTERELILVSSRGGKFRKAPHALAGVSDLTGKLRRVRFSDTDETVEMETDDAAEFAALLADGAAQVTATARAAAEQRELVNAEHSVRRSSFLVVTTNDLPGFAVTAVHGDVFGVTVRTRNTFANTAANVRTIVGGEVAGYTRLVTEARHEARQRMIDRALELGANAVIAMRFDASEIGGIMNETLAYGTAVTVERTPPAHPARGNDPRYWERLTPRRDRENGTPIAAYSKRAGQMWIDG